MVQQISSNTFCAAAIIVSPDPTQGTHTTWTAAIAAASAGSTILIRDGTYTEDPVMKAGLNIVASTNDGSIGNVVLIGNLQCSYSGNSSVSGIKLQTNGAACVTLSGANATGLYLNNCYINSVNATGIVSNGSNASSFISISNCGGDIGTTGIRMWLVSNGNLGVYQSIMTNSGSSTTATSFSGSQLDIRNCAFSFSVQTSGSTATLGLRYSVLDCNGVNQIMVAHNSTNAGTCQIYECFVASGTSSAISVGAGAQLQAYSCVVNSSHVNTIAGAGSITYSNLIFSGTTSHISTTTQVVVPNSQLSFDGTNLLDTYAVSTWTPTITGSTGNPTPTYTAQVGKYIKIGKLVFVVCEINVSALTGGTGFLQVSGLPFTSDTTANQIAILPGLIVTTLFLRSIFEVQANTTIIKAIFDSDAGSTAVALPQTTITAINFSGCYIAST